MRLLFLLILVVIWAPPADAALRTFYVSTSGTDTPAAGSSASPWRTLQYAAGRLQAGDLVIVRAGSYTGFDLRTSGTEANPIEFRADPGVVVNARNAITPDGINLEGASWIVIEGFTVTGVPRAGIRAVTNHHVTVRGNTLHANGTWGFLSGFSDDLLIEHNTASNSQIEHGIYVSNSGDRPTIRHNHVFGNRANGIHMNGDLSQGGDGIISGALVENNVIHDNGAAGGSAINCDGVQGSRILNNVIYGNHASGISLYRIDAGGPSTGNLVAHNTILQASDARWALNLRDGATGNTVLNNIFYNAHSFRGSITTTPDSLDGLVSDYNVVMHRFSTDDGESVITLPQWRMSTGQDAHSIVALPADLFVDPAGNDYHLKASAPARDAGLTLPQVTRDLDGVTRPSGPASDIGAYEVATATFTLSVARRGPAGGRVTSTPPGIDCGNSCSASFTAGGQVTLTASPAAGASFARWTGACTGTAPQCVVTLTAAMTATATFSQAFTDPALVPGSTPVRAAHVAELRAAIDALRAARSLPAVTWSNAPLVAGSTPIRAVHLVELRAALDGVYAADGLTAPDWGAAPVATVTPITAAQIEQIRAAVRAVE